MHINNRFCLYLSFLVYCYRCCCCDANTPPNYSPSSYSYRHRSSSPTDNEEEIDLGTTLVAIKYSEGVIVGADTRTSVGGYVSNKFAYKINPIFEIEEERFNGDDNDNDSKSNDGGDLTASSSSSSCVLCRSGSAADTQWLAQNAKHQFRIRTLERPGYRPTISQVAHYLRYLMRDSQKDDSSSASSLQASLICAGYNTIEGKGQIFGITPGGSLWEENYFCVSGSGSIVLLGYLDSLFNMKEVSLNYTEEKATKLVTKLLRLSIARDGSSGGLIRLYVINQDGLKEHVIYPMSSINSSTGGGSGSGSDDLKGFAKSTPVTRS